MHHRAGPPGRKNRVAPAFRENAGERQMHALERSQGTGLEIRRAGSECLDHLFFFFSSRRRHTRSVSAFLLNRSSDLPLQLKLLTTYIPKTSAFTLAFSTSERLRTTRASARTFFTFRHYITPSARNF